MKVNSATIKAVHAASAAKDPLRPALTMAHVDPTRGVVTVTDSYRLMTARCMEASEAGAPVNIPPAMVKALPHVKHMPYATEITADDETHITASNVLAEVSHTQYVEAGHFPNYSQLLTEAATTDRLTSAITVSTALLADILKGFSKLGDDSVTIAFGDPNRPLLITPNKNQNSAALLMPVRNSEPRRNWSEPATDTEAAEAEARAETIAHVIATVDALISEVE